MSAAVGTGMIDGAGGTSSVGGAGGTEHFDVAVIGGGIVGTATALALARGSIRGAARGAARGPGTSVVVLEPRSGSRRTSRATTAA